MTRPETDSPAKRAKPLSEELRDEMEVVPGTIRAGKSVISWSDHRLRIVGPLAGDSGRLGLGAGEVGALQVSRARRAEGAEESDWLDVELRGRNTPRIRLSARVSNPDTLEGLPWYDAAGVEIDLYSLRGIVSSARALGAEVTSWGAEREPDTPLRSSRVTPALGAPQRLVSLGSFAVRLTSEELEVRRAGFARGRTTAITVFCVAVAAGMFPLGLIDEIGRDEAMSLVLGIGVLLGSFLVAAYITSRRWKAQGSVRIGLGDKGTLRLQNDEEVHTVNVGDIQRFGMETEERRTRNGKVVDCFPLVRTQFGSTRLFRAGGKVDTQALIDVLNAIVLQRGGPSELDRAAESVRKHTQMVTIMGVVIALAVLAVLAVLFL